MIRRGRHITALSMLLALVLLAGCGGAGPDNLPTAVAAGAQGSPASPQGSRQQAVEPSSQSQPQATATPPAAPPPAAQPEPQAPAGERILFERAGKVYAGSTSGAPVLLGENRSNRMPRSPDLQWVLMKQGGLQSDPFTLVSTSSGQARELPFHNFVNLAWLPGGQEILVLEDLGVKQCILAKVSLNTGKREGLANYACESIALSHDGKYLLATSAQDGMTAQVVALDRPFSPTDLSFKPAPDSYLRWLPGNRILFHYRFGLSILEKDGTPVGSLRADEGGLLFRGVAIDPSARWAVASYGQGEKTWGTALYDLTTFKKVKELPLDDKFWWIGWSADSRYFATADRGNSRVTVWDTQSWTALDTGDLLKGMSGQGKWSASGHRLLLRRDSDRTVVVVDLTTRKVLPVRGSEAAESFDWQGP